nr:uncharacterized protein LOC112293358 isoform X2 [Physcomitrium patens]|eukprot:XP_024398433.1 uncharacterized protein LOC112293358 isoform X2 [Physcomitrella patens]
MHINLRTCSDHNCLFCGSEQWQLVTQNQEEKRCLAHVLECVGDNMKPEDCINSSNPTVVGMDPNVLKCGLLIRRKTNKMVKNEKCFIVVIVGKLYLFHSQQIQGQHVHLVTSLLQANIRMVKGLEFEILLPGMKSINLIASHVHDMTEWIGAIGRSIETAKEKIQGKYFSKSSNEDQTSQTTHETIGQNQNLNKFQYQHQYQQFDDDNYHSQEDENDDRNNEYYDRSKKKVGVGFNKRNPFQKIELPQESMVCDRSGGGGIVQLFIENGGCGNRNPSTSQITNRFQPYTPKLPKLTYPTTNKVCESKSSSSRRKPNYSCHELYLTHDKHNHMACCEGKKMKNKKHLESDSDLCSLNDFHKNDLQPINATKDLCCSPSPSSLLRRECEGSQHNTTNCYTSCHEHAPYSRNNGDYSCGTPEVVSTINHFRSKNCLRNLRLEPRRYPPSWMPIRNQLTSSPQKSEHGTSATYECNNSSDCDEKFSECGCCEICGGGSLRSSPDCSQISESGSISNELDGMNTHENEDDTYHSSYLQQGWQEHKNERGDRFYYHPATKRFNFVPPSIKEVSTNFNPSNDATMQ